MNLMHRKTLIVTLILVGVGISACGYKGPVYYPTPEQRKELQERDERMRVRKEARQAKKYMQAQAHKTTSVPQPHHSR